MKGTKWIWSIVLGVLFSGQIWFHHTTFVYAKSKDTHIYSGISVDGIDLGGKTKDEAENVIKEYVKSLKNKKIHIKTDLASIEYTLKDFGMKSNSSIVLEDAYAYGKIGNIIRRYKDQKDSKYQPVNFILEKKIEKKEWKNQIKGHEKDFVVHAKNATVKRVNQKFKVIDETYGNNIEYNQGYEEFLQYLNKTWNGEDGEFSLPTSVDEPDYKRADLEQVKDVLGTFTTNFSSSSSDRSQNIETGAAHINGTVVYPGEEFSTYSKVAPYTYDNGYRTGKAYSNGEVIDSIGGGICQVSTTLYNALLRSELEITERYPHSMNVSYVSLAADAAMADTYKNLKFKNNTKTPVYIEAVAVNRNVTFTIYGKDERPKDQEVKFRSEMVDVYYPGADIVTYDNSMLEGQMIVTQVAHTGYKANLWKDIYKNGKKVDSILVNTSVYQASPRRVIVGTKKREVKKPKIEKEQKMQSEQKKTEVKEKKQPEKAEQKEKQEVSEKKEVEQKKEKQED